VILQAVRQASHPRRNRLMPHLVLELRSLAAQMPQRAMAQHHTLQPIRRCKTRCVSSLVGERDQWVCGVWTGLSQFSASRSRVCDGSYLPRALARSAQKTTGALPRQGWELDYRRRPRVALKSVDLFRGWDDSLPRLAELDETARAIVNCSFSRA